MFRFDVKNMVCNRCILVVSNELKNLGIEPVSVQLGEVELAGTFFKAQLTKLKQSFEDLGFEILVDPNKQFIEAIKKLLIGKVQSQDIEPLFSISIFLMNALNKDYSTISKRFSQVEGITIVQFFILQKIE